MSWLKWKDPIQHVSIPELGSGSKNSNQGSSSDCLITIECLSPNRALRTDPQPIDRPSAFAPLFRCPLLAY
jgi:hypothetical protein